MTYNEIVKKIKNLEIQGAEKIAVKAVEAFALKLKETKDPKKLLKYAKELTLTRPTEPALRNSINFCLKNFIQKPNVAEEVTKHFENGKKTIAELGSKKISNGMIVFTHCHSSTVTQILIKAKKQGKKFEVFNTETRPKFQGRITAAELAENKIPVTHFVDSAARGMLKKVDLFLFGCDAITSEGLVINKIGTATIAEIAKNYNIPSFTCTNSWKFDPETVLGEEEIIEERDPKEVWDKPPKGVKIFNPAFEITSPDLLTGIISEIGVFKPEAFIIQIQRKYPWLIS
jgi:ribose 1,5-bisphosphate isomerase